MTFAGKSAGRTELRKHSLFKHLSAGIGLCRECAAFGTGITDLFLRSVCR